MRALVCGGRNFQNRAFLFAALDKLLPAIEHVIEGGADGADSLAREWARSRYIPFTEFTAAWPVHGKAAGSLRNARMLAERPDCVIAFPGGKGTRNMINLAEAAGVKVLKLGDTPRSHDEMQEGIETI